MGLESGNYINQLIVTNPTSTDKRRQGDDHLRLLKVTIKNSFPNVNGAVKPTVAEFNYLVGVTDLIQDQLDLKLIADDIATLADLTVANSWLAGQSTPTIVVPFVGAFRPDAALSNSFSMTLTGNVTLQTPSKPISGQILTIWFRQNAAGGKLLSFGSTFYGNSTADWTLSTAANAVDMLVLAYDGVASVWRALALHKGVDDAL